MIALPPPVLIAQADVSPVEIWDLQQVRIAGDTDPAKVKQLEPAHSIDQAIGILKQLGVPYVRTRATLQPDKLPADIRAAIVALPEGEPFVLPDGAYISINVIVGRALPSGATGWRPRPSLLLAARAGIA